MSDWSRLAVVAGVMVFLLLVGAASMALACEHHGHAPPAEVGPGILVPAATLLLGSGILTYAILRKRP